MTELAVNDRACIAWHPRTLVTCHKGLSCKLSILSFPSKNKQFLYGGSNSRNYSFAISFLQQSLTALKQSRFDSIVLSTTLKP